MECFGLPSHSMSYPFDSTSFSSASSSYGPFIPTSRVSTPHEFSALEPDASYTFSYRVDVSSQEGAGNVMLDAISTKPEQMPFPNGPPNKPTKQELIDFDYREISMAHKPSMDPLATSRPETFAISHGAVIDATSFVMTPTQVSSGFKDTSVHSPWSRTSSSPFLQSNDDIFDIDRQPEYPYYIYDSHCIRDADSLEQARPRQIVTEEIHKTAEIPSIQARSPGKRAIEPVPISAKPVWSSCDYPGCDRAFRRKEHLKRHKQSFHGEGPNRFLCEFCGKGDFNRRDNLNIHRKLHARRNSHNRRVKFVADAVTAIEQEKRSRRFRARTRQRDQWCISGQG
ncbi:uncharacterized protein NECHADRAFT_39683 [Fusarium vanettenii 77-13-4]|uniref:C2H2-type domain-containing protein n=1 Tax=Fusarium vanettenii (strain ATCC MYA-4622 / CBS 123669 / FGSC 9596 / NRRL 45880 / 77-13-4) TaxID=660122 RepID=C7ZM24_FUSV7|nr:uncharacterized protein NECHADRAFT_39683 [Fusarium vanettenii 77-13-4]EEU34921.1 hypothetical protein NECHADRAFT_39683 [Fusarium vanettenii 77-13-4]